MRGPVASRRTALQGALACGGVALLTGCAIPTVRSAGGRAALDPLAEGCRDLYLYGLAALEMARARERTMGPQPNVFRHVRAPASAASRRVTTPNNDTLYSSAWLDLRSGAVELDVPATGDRYFSIALLDMHSNNFHVGGLRRDGGRAHRIRLVPPDATPAAGEVRAPTWWVWAQGRTLFSSAQDLPAAHAVQDGLGVRARGIDGGAAPPSPPPMPPTTAPALTQLSAMSGLLDGIAPPARADGPFLARSRALGLSTSTLVAADGALAAAAERGVDAARRDIRAVIDAAETVDGWIFSRPTIGDFGTDYLYRAAIAVWGLAALPPVEAVYVRAAGPGPSASFDGMRPHRLRFAPGALPPVGAFWSLSLYEVLPSGELYFFDNPLQRYAIGDRTPGLARGADGSLEIRIAADDPGPALRANWLPCPRGPFSLVLRAYLPGPGFVSGRYRLPPVEPV